jgi:hypothetical protein
MLKMPWGKFKGRPIDQVESSYLAWLIDNAESLDENLRCAIGEELGRRYAPKPTPCPEPEIAANVISAGVRSLAKTAHPDIGGDTRQMQLINAVADWLRQQL